MDTPAFSQKDLRASDYRSRIRNHKDGNATVAIASVSKDYTPGITEAPQGEAAIAVAFPYKTKLGFI